MFGGVPPISDGTFANDNWTNFGDNFNHLVGFGVPVPSPNAGVVLCSFEFLYLTADYLELTLGPSTPSSVDGQGPAIADGIDPDILITCHYTGAPWWGGVVATLNGGGIEFPGDLPTQQSSWTDVKTLFE